MRVPADLPSPSSTWPRYPGYSSHSCWTPSIDGGPPLRAAPSIPVVSPAPHTSPGEVVRRALSRLGDRRYVLRVSVSSPPPVTLSHLRGYFAGARPPRDARWAYVSVAHEPPGMLAALEQRFPNPSPIEFSHRVALVGRRYGFSVQELRLLRPRQLAPPLVVRTERDRKAFVHDVPAIMKLLDPVSTSRGAAAITFEGFFFEARDARGPFVRVDDAYRGQVEGGEWSWNRCVYPYPHSEPFGARACPG